MHKTKLFTTFVFYKCSFDNLALNFQLKRSTLKLEVSEHNKLAKTDLWAVFLVSKSSFQVKKSSKTTPKHKNWDLSQPFSVQALQIDLTVKLQARSVGQLKNDFVSQVLKFSTQFQHWEKSNLQLKVSDITSICTKWPVSCIFSLSDKFQGSWVEILGLQVKFLVFKLCRLTLQSNELTQLD